MATALMASPHTGQGLVSTSMIAPLQLRYTPFAGRRQMRFLMPHSFCCGADPWTDSGCPPRRARGSPPVCLRCPHHPIYSVARKGESPVRAAFVVLIWPLPGALRRQFTKTTISGDRLRYETGAFSKSTRTIQLSKLQDLRVDQTITQRMFGVGNLSIETAGAASWEAIEDVDNPQSLADEILNRAHGIQHETQI